MLQHVDQRLGTRLVEGAKRCDAVARLLERTGHEVHREYYLNDRGVQMANFVASLDARKAGFETYVIEDACRGIDTQGSLAKAWADMTKAGVKRIKSDDIVA